jgi:hypothetical protein
LEIVALARHAHSEVPDTTPRVEPAVEGMKHRRQLTFEAKEAQRGEHKAGATVSLGWHSEILFRCPREMCIPWINEHAHA